ncbi:MAG: lysophospholipid acyltransferase family protein [Thermodesulfobacteriota bacterium]
MKRLSYNIFRIASKFVGLWVLKLFAWVVSSGYFLFFPNRVRVGLRFYRALFPDRSRLAHIWYTWRQYHHFARLFVERVMLDNLNDISFTSQGFEHLKTAITDRSGGIILMSHLGNWEVAAHLLHRELPGIRLLLYMGVKDKEAIEKMQKQGLTDAGIRIVALDRDGGSPFDLVEGIKVLQQGGFVSMTGDVLWHHAQRNIRVSFLGHEVRVPETPYRLALLSGAPLFIFFSYRTQKADFHFVSSEPIHLHAVSREQREETIRSAAQTYAGVLEQAVRDHPFEWYHFEPFLGPPRRDSLET